MRPLRGKEAGLTLVELMVALAILGIAIAAAFGFGWSVMNAYRDQRVSNQVSRAARGSLDTISYAIRGGSSGVPTGNLVDLVGCDSAFTGIEVENDASDGTDALTAAYASGGVLSTLRQTFAAGDSSIYVFDASEFQPGDLVIVTDFNQGHLMTLSDATVVGVPDDDQDDRLDLTGSPSSLCSFPLTWPSSGGYQPGSLVLRARIARFFVDTSVAGRPALIMDPDNDASTSNEEPLALGVEDLQVAVGVDVNGDGTVTDIGAAAGDDEWFHNVPGEAGPPDITVTPWRALRVTLVARSLAERSQAALSTPLVIEDHDPGAPPDEFRRRAVHAIIELRNLQGSP